MHSTLELKNVSFGYGKEEALFKDVSLAFASNERVALHAPSGFGKTTLCRLLSGYLEPAQGEVLLDGAPLSRKGSCPVQLIGQHPEHMIDPLIKVRSSLEEAGSIDEALLGALGVREAWLDRYPRELSGGELQRCCIARTLRVKPRFIVADEVSTMLDAITQVEIWNVLLSYCERENAGLILVTHSEALRKRLATRTVVL